MEAIEEITSLTEKAVATLLAGRKRFTTDRSSKCQRKVVRWPFPGTVQLWLPDDNGSERLLLGTSVNLSVQGIAIRCDEELRLGSKIPIAIHEPELSLQGTAVVRHCTAIDNGTFFVGMQFLFDSDDGQA